MLKYVKNTCDESGIKLNEANRAKIRALARYINIMVTTQNRGDFLQAYRAITSRGYKSKGLTNIYNLVNSRVQMNHSSDPDKATKIQQSIDITKKLGFAVENVINDLIFGYDDYDDYLF